MSAKSNPFSLGGNPAYSFIGDKKLNDAPVEDEPISQASETEKPVRESKLKDQKPSEPKTTAAAKPKTSSLKEDFKKTQKAKPDKEKKKKLIAIPAECDKKVSEMIEKGECQSFNQLVNFLLEKFFES